MLTGAVSIQAAEPGDFPAITFLLAENKLPVEDLTPELLAGFWSATQGGKLTGVIGLQRFGAAGLLRSLAVAGERRGEGLGKHLVATLEAAARDTGIQEIYLLTQTAEAFFVRLGYRQIPREAAPQAVRASREFAQLCPSSAVCLVKRL